MRLETLALPRSLVYLAQPIAQRGTFVGCALNKVIPHFVLSSRGPESKTAFSSAGGRVWTVVSEWSKNRNLGRNGRLKFLFAG